MRQHLLSGKGMRKLGCYLTLILLSIIFLFPLYWFFLNSFKSYEQLFQFPPEIFRMAASVCQLSGGVPLSGISV